MKGIGSLLMGNVSVLMASWRQPMVSAKLRAPKLEMKECTLTKSRRTMATAWAVAKSVNQLLSAMNACNWATI